MNTASSPKPLLPVPGRATPVHGNGRQAKLSAALALDPIVQRSPFGMALIDAAGLYRRVNPAYAHMYGYAPSEMIGLSFGIVVPEVDREQVLARHAAFLASGGEPGSKGIEDGSPGANLSGERVVQRRDGSEIVIKLESLHWPDVDGSPCRLVYVVDITGHRRMTESLQRSRHFLQSVLDGLAAHVCVLDEQGDIVAVNRAWREFSAANGGTLDTVFEGLNYLQVCEQATLPSAPGGDDAQLFVARLREVLAGRGSGFEYSYSCHAPGVSRWFVARVSRIADNGSSHTVVAHDEITALKQAQLTLQEQQALLLDVTESIPGAIFRAELRMDAEGLHWRLLYMSAGVQQLFGISPQECIADGSVLPSCVHESDRAGHDASLLAALEKARAWEHEFRIRARDGQLKWLQVRAQPQPVAGVDPHVVWIGLLSDVTERKRMESALLASELTYRTLFETVPQGIVYHDASGVVTAANPAAQRILGLSLEQMQGRSSLDPHWQVVHLDGRALTAEEHPAMVALRTQQPVRDRVIGVRIRRREPVWLLASATPVLRDGVLQAVHASFEDITQRVLSEQVLQRQAQTDDLTGAANRRVLMSRLEVEFERVQRHPQMCFAVLALDLDHFKQVNDQWGHAAGDAVLRNLVKTLQPQMRGPDLLARIGGEEFVVLLPDTTLAEAAVLAERLRRQLHRHPTVHGQQQITVSTSVGVAVVSGADHSPEAVLARADRALYEAKSAGRNSVRCCPPLS